MLAAVLADCMAAERIREIFSEHRPTIVFHAAAYKHVGLMEANPIEAVRNNAIATRVVAHVAGELGAERFVLVSTDKAVAPATVMGASKALAEFALEAASGRFPGTCYAAVRFGNVLGSSGSVVPIFRRQIERGGPVTVTDERMTRYFMTIPEAVQLIIRSGALAREGREQTSSNGAPSGVDVAGAASATPTCAEVFVLDMGEPVRIVELARAMIELSGLDPERDIGIEIVGKRPGEKLHEELFNSYERPAQTDAEKILRAERSPLGVQAVEAMFAEIRLLVLEGDAAGLAAKVSELSSRVREADAGDADESVGRRAEPASEGVARRSVPASGGAPRRAAEVPAEELDAGREDGRTAPQPATAAAKPPGGGLAAPVDGVPAHPREAPAPLVHSPNQ
jgi:FlaA1/EpsC-like NDP-sugar epimerase